MKQANFIISHLRQQPSLKKLEQSASYKKLFALLPNRLTSAIKFAYNKNQTLFIVLKHSGYKMEFNYKTTLIKSLLKELILKDSTCKNIDADEIKVFATNKTSPLKTKTLKTQCYSEKSTGSFTNSTKNEKLYNTFEEIRKIICSNKQ